MLKVIISGVTGRMGKELLAAIAADNSFVLAKGLSSRDHPWHTQVIAAQFAVFIDFSSPAVLAYNVEQCVKYQRPMVIGLTGLTIDHHQLIADAAKEIAILYSPNMSIGVNLCYKLVDLASRVLDPTWQIAIHELHHQHKKDSPSGTSLQLAKNIPDSKFGVVQFSSIRGGDITGEHTVMFMHAGERVEITHRATNRAIFAQGALQAAKWVYQQSPGLYSMQDLILY